MYNIKKYPRFYVGDNGWVLDTKLDKCECGTKNGAGYYGTFLGFNHRLVAEYFLPNWDNSLQVNHKDGNKTNNHYSNLEMVTQSENMLHLSNVLGKNRGESRPSNKLTKEMVYEICSTFLYMDLSSIKLKDLYSQMANYYNVSVQTISNIWNCGRWKHITKEFVQTNFRDYHESEYTQVSGNGEYATA
ncbi:MAG: HNH endonuclease signature motif containing protein [Nitrososphaeraceae archaeon]|nr:HNH endonuclease signature motif containing protein [Nitrososphaeraceae archaeon]